MCVHISVTVGQYHRILEKTTLVWLQYLPLTMSVADVLRGCYGDRRRGAGRAVQWRFVLKERLRPLPDTECSATKDY